MNAFKCDYCDKAYGAKNGLERHVKTVHEKFKDLKCETCDEVFVDESTLKRHVRTVHENIKPCNCESCHKRFANEWTLNKHINVKHETVKFFGCDFCNKHFGYKKNLQYHLNNAPKRPLPEETLSFVKDYKSNAELKSKSKTEEFEKYEKNESLACKFCGKKFVMKIALKKHLEKIHQKTFVDNFLNK